MFSPSFDAFKNSNDRARIAISSKLAMFREGGTNESIDQSMERVDNFVCSKHNNPNMRSNSNKLVYLVN